MATEPKSLHVVPNPVIGWDIKEGGSTHSIGHFDTKQEAENAARQMSQNGTELYIHGKNGKIQRKDSHGNDPYPPKG